MITSYSKDVNQKAEIPLEEIIKSVTIYVKPINKQHTYK